jgi:hypothetical protein
MSKDFQLYIPQTAREWNCERDASTGQVHTRHSVPLRRYSGTVCPTEDLTLAFDRSIP